MLRLLLLAALLLGGCASTPNFDARPSKPVELQGRWVLDAGRSDDAEAIVMTALKQQKEGKGKAKPGKAVAETPDSALATAGTGDTEPRKLISNPDWLEIEQDPDRVVISMAGKEYRRFALGGEVAWVGKAGPFKTWSGWKGTTLIAVSKNPRKLKVTERYALDAEGVLTRKVKMEIAELDDAVWFRQVFVRSDYVDP